MFPFSLIQLEYIVAIDTHRHFVTAAEACHVTQPTLSMQVRKVEEALQVEIFDRSKQPVIPTDIGMQVIAQARQILAAARALPEAVNHYKGIVSGTLRIGIIPTLASYLLPRFLGAFMAKHPSVELHIQELQTSQVAEALHRDALDAGLIVTPLREKGIVERPLFYEEIMAYVHDGFPQESPILVDQLAKSRLWLLSEGHCFRNQAMNLCQLRTEALPLKGFEFESGSLETLRRLVDAEGGATLLPQLAALDLAETNQVRAFQEPVPMREISLVHSRHFAKRRLLEVFEKALLEATPLPRTLPEGADVISWK